MAEVKLIGDVNNYISLNIGDIVKITNDYEDTCLVVQTGGCEFNLISLCDGNRYSDAHSSLESLSKYYATHYCLISHIKSADVVINISRKEV